MTTSEAPEKIFHAGERVHTPAVGTGSIMGTVFYNGNPFYFVYGDNGQYAEVRYNVVKRIQQ